jgi:hypothetical protein
MTRAFADAEADRGDGKAGVAPTAAVLQSRAIPTVASGELAEEVLRLKAQPGKFLLARGSPGDPRSRTAAVLRPEEPVHLHLISATPFSSGVLAVIYQPR